MHNESTKSSIISLSLYNLKIREGILWVPPTPAMWFNLSSDAQQLTMRIVFVLCCSFIPAKFTNKWKCCLPVFDYDFLVQNAFRNRA